MLAEFLNLTLIPEYRKLTNPFFSEHIMIGQWIDGWVVGWVDEWMDG